METNSIRLLMEFEHQARMQLAYMPKFMPFNEIDAVKNYFQFIPEKESVENAKKKVADAID